METDWPRCLLSGKALAEYDAAEGEAKEILYAQAASQWMTDDELAARIVKWAGVSGYVLEPSCGTGAFARAAKAVGADVTTIDLDPQFKADVCRDYLDCTFTERFTWIVTNPPYEGGLDTAFLEKAASEADDVVALVRLNALAGQKRYDAIWKHVTVAGLVILKNRPSFRLVHREMGTPRHDFAVVHYTFWRNNVVIKPTEWW